MKTLTQSKTIATVALVKSLAIALLLSACSDTTSPFASDDDTNAARMSSINANERQAWGPEIPNFNLEAILRGEGNAFGLVNFRQPNDDKLIVYLDVWVRDLEPNTEYQLQRAVDTNLDGNCTGTNWLTLGKGTVAQSILTDDTGTGKEQLFRSVAAFPVGSTFDIHFRVIKKSDAAVALTSDCYQFTISQ